MQLSAALATVATALLVVGLLIDDGLGPIVLSIVASVTAGAVLVQAGVRNRREGRTRLSG